MFLTVQYSTVEYSTVEYSTIEYSTSHLITSHHITIQHHSLKRTYERENIEHFSGQHTDLIYDQYFCFDPSRFHFSSLHHISADLVYWVRSYESHTQWFEMQEDECEKSKSKRTYTNEDTYTYMHKYVCVCMCTHTHTHTNKNINTHTCTHTLPSYRTWIPNYPVSKAVHHLYGY